MHKYGKPILKYYQIIELNKRKLYEEFDKLLDEIKYISI